MSKICPRCSESGRSMERTTLVQAPCLLVDATTKSAVTHDQVVPQLHGAETASGRTINQEVSLVVMSRPAQAHPVLTSPRRCCSHHTPQRSPSIHVFDSIRRQAIITFTHKSSHQVQGELVGCMLYMPCLRMGYSTDFLQIRGA